MSTITFESRAWISDTVALQAVELATLIPLRLGCRRLILVGDPKQLPATIFSRVAINLVRLRT